MSEQQTPGRDVMRALVRAERAAARRAMTTLPRNLGWPGTVRVLARVALGRLSGQPFARLGPPQDDRDRLSRRQCGPVVLLYESISELRDRDTALSICRDLIAAGAMPFLDAMIPEIPDADLHRFGSLLASQFFNADSAVAVDEDVKELRVEVTRCRFVELVRAVDAAPLAELFCAPDLDFFVPGRRGVTLTRPQTLAGGGSSCDFRFRRASG